MNVFMVVKDHYELPVYVGNVLVRLKQGDVILFIKQQPNDSWLALSRHGLCTTFFMPIPGPALRIITDEFPGS